MRIAYACQGRIPGLLPNFGLLSYVYRVTPSTMPKVGPAPRFMHTFTDVFVGVFRRICIRLETTLLKKRQLLWKSL